MKLTYLGHSAFWLDASGYKLVFDPFITGNPMASVKPKGLKPDYILISHGHSDHLGDSLEIARGANATIIAPYELAIYCQNMGANISPMHIGGKINLPFGWVKLTLALHGGGIETSDGIICGGNPCGFLLHIEGKYIYHAGDTGLFSDMRLIAEWAEERLDVALLPIGGRFTMDVEDAARAAEFLRAKYIIPMHYNTFEPIKADPSRLIPLLQDISTRVIILKPGDIFSL